MKAYQVSLLLTALMVVMTGCEYDVKQPLWYQDFQNPPTPVITQIEPPRAIAGVNTITIRGENFATPPATNDVYFDNLPAEIVETSATSIKVRRPNLVTDSCTIKVVSSQALVVAKYGPYRIDPVMVRYGAFLENTVLSVVAVDSAENLYVVEAASLNVYKITPEGDKTIIATVTRAPTDASIGPDGNLYLPGYSRAIEKVNLTTGVVERWTQLPAGKNVKYGDFDAQGYFYTGGTRTDLVVVPFNLATTPTSAGFYATEEILAIRVYHGYIYVASRTSTKPAKIWRHPLDANGNVGSQELVLDMSETGEFSSRLIKAITFSANGTLYLATDSPNPLLSVDPATQTVDFFYKNILPPYCKHFSWGNGTYLYLISGNTSPAQEWTVYRVDMGTKSAS
ncbi:MAG: IPT/TIG domain-containing protein [candidate division KSB1 bacterium]|nr:IPT/TIG domain-containing protein [candidate division KSB1 bacterium]